MWNSAAVASARPPASSAFAPISNCCPVSGLNGFSPRTSNAGDRLWLERPGPAPVERDLRRGLEDEPGVGNEGIIGAGLRRSRQAQLPEVGVEAVVAKGHQGLPLVPEVDPVLDVRVVVPELLDPVEAGVRVRGQDRSAVDGLVEVDEEADVAEPKAVEVALLVSAAEPDQEVVGERAPAELLGDRRVEEVVLALVDLIAVTPAHAPVVGLHAVVLEAAPDVLVEDAPPVQAQGRAVREGADEVGGDGRTFVELLVSRLLVPHVDGRHEVDVVLGRHELLVE